MIMMPIQKEAILKADSPSDKLTSNVPIPMAMRLRILITISMEVFGYWPVDKFLIITTSVPSPTPV